MVTILSCFVLNYLWFLSSFISYVFNTWFAPHGALGCPYRSIVITAVEQPQPHTHKIILLNETKSEEIKLIWTSKQLWNWKAWGCCSPVLGSPLLCSAGCRSPCCFSPCCGSFRTLSWVTFSFTLKIELASFSIQLGRLLTEKLNDWALSQ